MASGQHHLRETPLFSSNVLVLLLVIAALTALIVSLKSILMPFVLAMIFAYLLDPAVSKLQKYKIPRMLGTIIAVVLFFILLTIALLTISPMLISQSKKMVAFLSTYTHKLDMQYWLSFLHKVQLISPDIIEKIQQSISEFSSSLVVFAADLLKSIFNSGIVAINIISFVFITPVITFYITRDWPIFIKNLLHIIPPKYRKDSNQLMQNLDNTLSSYLRGQLYVCFLLGIYYSFALTLLRIESSLVLGMMAGFLTFIPYVGAIFAGAFTILVAALQFGTWNYVLITAAIFVVGQVLEGTFLTPNLIGSQVGLHPVWIMFGLLAGGVLLGFFGILIAVPLTATAGVVIKFMFKKYLASSLYKS